MNNIKQFFDNIDNKIKITNTKKSLIVLSKIIKKELKELIRSPYVSKDSIKKAKIRFNRSINLIKKKIKLIK